ncbi:MAG: DotU family type IV/VI secretion system protein [Planctomycetia bacterium]|nr:DotU family type IV/VI secretion system protein [Planctomycetia bacterium]
MTPKFSRAVDEVFVYVIGLLTRIEQNEDLNPGHEKTQIRGLLDRAEAKVESRDEWRLAKYGLVAWIDEALTQAEWKAREWWQERSLEQDYFRTGDAGIQFFVRAREAQECTNKDALEVFYVCVMLGFRGVYGARGGAEQAEQYNLDPSLDAWIERTAIAIKLRQGRPPISGIPQVAVGAPPLEARFQFLGMALFTLMLIVATVLTGVWFWWPDTRDKRPSEDSETAWRQSAGPGTARGGVPT